MAGAAARAQFGLEYERTAREKGSEEEADKELRRRRGSLERRGASSRSPTSGGSNSRGSGANRLA